MAWSLGVRRKVNTVGLFVAIAPMEVEEMRSKRICRWQRHVHTQLIRGESIMIHHVIIHNESKIRGPQITLSPPRWFQ